MSKSKGNVIDAKELLEKYPVDLVRFYFIWKSSPIESLNFSIEELMSRPYQVLSTIYNLHLYFKQNSEYDKFDSKTHSIDQAKKSSQLGYADKWLLSKLQKLIEKVTYSNDECKLHESAKSIDDFIVNSLSQIYIPLIRGEMISEDTKNERRFVIYSILKEVLQTLDLLIHPFCPFTSEYLYQTTIGNKKSIILEMWPQKNDSYIDDEIEEAFDVMKDVVSISAAARMKGKLKRRWPLEEAIIFVDKSEEEKFKRVHEIALTQLNVKNYRISELENHEGLEQYIELKQKNAPIIPKIELERKTIGPKAKQFMPELVEKFRKTNSEEILKGLSRDGTFSFKINGIDIILDKQDFIIDFDVSQDYVFANRDNRIVIISTKRNRELMIEGLVKDLARRLQSLRKERGYNPTEILNTASILDLQEEQLDMIKERTKDLESLVRVKQVNFTQSCKEYKDDDIDGQKIRISVE